MQDWQGDKACGLQGSAHKEAPSGAPLTCLHSQLLSCHPGLLGPCLWQEQLASLPAALIGHPHQGGFWTGSGLTPKPSQWPQYPLVLGSILQSFHYIPNTSLYPCRDFTLGKVCLLCVCSCSWWCSLKVHGKVLRFLPETTVREQGPTTYMGVSIIQPASSSS